MPQVKKTTEDRKVQVENDSKSHEHMMTSVVLPLWLNDDSISQIIEQAQTPILMLLTLIVSQLHSSAASVLSVWKVFLNLFFSEVGV